MSPPERDCARTTATTVPGAGKETLRDAGSVALDGTALQTAEKQFATVAAEAALIGATLLRLDDGSLLLSRWQWGKQLPDLDAVRDLLKRMRGVR
jgi:hypothetical protein